MPSQYLYRDFDFRRHIIRCVRLPNFPTRTSNAYQPTGGFHQEGEPLEAGPHLTTHVIHLLRELREQQRTENRLVYFDIEDANLSNPGKEMRDFEDGAATDDTDDWEFKVGYLV